MKSGLLVICTKYMSTPKFLLHFEYYDASGTAYSPILNVQKLENYIEITGFTTVTEITPNVTHTAPNTFYTKVCQTPLSALSAPWSHWRAKRGTWGWART